MRFRRVETLHQGRLSEVIRCTREPEQDTVILKRVPDMGLTASSVARLRYEHRLLARLTEAQVPHVVRCLAWTEYEGGPALVLEDFGGRAVSADCSGAPWELQEALQIGIQTARALRGLHRVGVVHKDVNPSNLVYSRERGALQLIDFGISSELPREVQITDNVRGLEGTLAYLPPEQTGRLARSVDWRADLYSLGATLYELFCGRVPFEREDRSRLLYAVVAEQPAPLEEVAAVPHAVAQLVRRLLAKAPEDRYQSAHGVLHDLQICAERLREAQPLALVLGAADRPERFALSEKLYGRTTALVALEAQYARAAQGGCALTLVRGPSGIGKSALVQELQPAIARDEALFGMGKCDALHRNVPFHVMRQALGTLVKRLLMLPPAQLEAAQRRVQAAVGNVGQALVALVPGLEALIGPQKPVSALGPQESENRLLMLFAQVFAALARRQPLVLFFDDLQWADLGTFKVLTKLCAKADVPEKLLLVLAYRDNEVSAEHPLEVMLRGVPEQGARAELLTVAPLTLDDIAHMISDATGAPLGHTQGLAALVHGKTDGNAFFVRDMLQQLWTLGLLRIDPQSGQWTWDAQGIATSAVSSAVADGMLGRWQGLPSEAQQALGAAACAGQDFSLRQVCLALQRSAHDVQRALALAMGEGLIIPLSDHYRYESSEELAQDVRYRFAHDKVQQAASQHTSIEMRAQWHHRLGNDLAQARAAGAPFDLFALAGHWNAAQALVAAAGRNLEAAQVNLEAGQQALQMSAPGKARECLSVGHAQLPADSWQSAYTLRRDMESALAEADFVSGDTPEAIARLDDVLLHQSTTLEKTRTLRRRSLLYNSHNLFAESMRDTFTALRMLGYPVVEHAGLPRIILEFIRLKAALGGRDIEALGDLPFSEDALWTETVLATEPLGVSALIVNPTILAVTCLQVVRLVVARGLVAASPYSFAAMFPVCAAMGDYRQSHQWHAALQRCLERAPDSKAHGTAAFLSLAYVDHTVLRPPLYMERAQEVSRLLLEEGQPVQATWPLMPLRIMAAATSISADSELLTRYDALLRDHGTADTHALHAMLASFAGWCEDREVAFKTDAESMTDAEALTPFNVTLFWTLQGEARWLTEDYGAALKAWRKAFHPQVFDNMDAVLVPTAFFAALSCTQHAQAHGRRRPSDGKIFKKAMGKLRALARGAPELFDGFVPLFEAELAVLRGRHGEAHALYEAAAGQLASSGWAAMGAAASECAARHARKQGLHAAAAAHLLRALQQCRLWGNRRKVRLLEQSFSEYFEASRFEADIVAVGRASAGRTKRSETNQGGTLTGGHDAVDFPGVLAVCRALSEERDVGKMASAILDFTLQSAAANRAMLLLDLRDGRGMHPFADTAKEPTPYPKQLVSLAARSQEMQLLNDVARGGERSEGLGDGRVKSVVAAPLSHQGDCIGVLVLENSLVTGAFTPDRLTMLNVFASQVAVAVENARSRDHLERIISERTQELREAHARILRYERDSAEVQMAGGFAHEMRNALASAGYVSDLLFGDTPGSLHLQTLRDLDALEQAYTLGQPEGVRAALQALRVADSERETIGVTITKAFRRGHALTEQILRYAEAGTLQPGDEAVDAQDLVSQVLRDLAQGAADFPPNTEVSVPADLMLPMREQHAYIILRNLLQNSADALRERPPQARQIVVRGEADPTRVLLAVEDSGSGMTSEVQGRVFQPFFSTKGAAGTGLGLGLSRKLAQVYGGDLRFSSEPSHGTRFELTLPRRS